MGDFAAVSKFRVNLVHGDGDQDRVIVLIGLEGLKIQDASSNRTMKSLELGHICRWNCRGSSLVLYTKTPSDVEERQLTLQSDSNTIQNVLDTLTCSCMQLAELLQSQQQSAVEAETANSLHALVVGNGKKKSKLPTADEVEYWKQPDKAGWLQCQGDHLKNWRKRWFVLKQGFLFRFINATVSESVKPRGVVDLSKVQDVKVASNVTHKSNSFQLKTASGGMVAYIADTETELVEWMSAIEIAMQKICKHAAGVEDEPATTAPKPTPAPERRKGGGSPQSPSEWMRQLEKNFENFDMGSQKSSSSREHSKGKEQASSSRSRSNNYNGSQMVDIVGYESLGNGGGGSSRAGGGAAGGGGSSGYGNSRPNVDYGGYGNGRTNSDLGYGNIAGATMVTVEDYAITNDPYLSRGQTQATYGNVSQAPYSNGSQQQTQQYSYGAGGGGYGAGAYASQQPSTQPEQHSQQQQSVANSINLMDAVPQQQPSYPYFQSSQNIASAPPQADTGMWQVHYTAEGRPYYYNLSSGSTQWEAPPGFTA